MKAPVFLSASIPDPKRHKRYVRTADVTAIREAVCALVAAVVPHARLVFGGHPAITPLVSLIAGHLGRADRIRAYQSAFFQSSFPPDNAAFRHLVVVPGVAGDRDRSLLKMRGTMIKSEPFCAGVFIGGMEGVEEELSIFNAAHPGALAFPIASTGGASRRLYEANVGPADIALRRQLLDTDVYGTLFVRLLDLAWNSQAPRAPSTRRRPGSK